MAECVLSLLINTLLCIIGYFITATLIIDIKLYKPTLENIQSRLIACTFTLFVFARNVYLPAKLYLRPSHALHPLRQTLSRVCRHCVKAHDMFLSNFQLVNCGSMNEIMGQAYGKLQAEYTVHDVIHIRHFYLWNNRFCIWVLFIYHWYWNSPCFPHPEKN